MSGNASEVSKTLADSFSINGPSLMLFNLKDDIYHSLVVVTGRTPDEVLTAAKAFSLISMPLPDSPSTMISDIQIPRIPPYTVKNGLEPGKSYTLAGLGFNTHTFKGISPIPKGFSFRLPSDTHLSPNSQAILSLNMAYGASMREDSVLNIQLNDKFVAAIPCKDINGGTYRNYKVGLLLSSMNAGYNKLTISPQLTPMKTDQCTMLQTGNLQLTVFEDSTFAMPSVDKWIEMPNLKAFIADAFPFGRLPDMGQSLVFLPDGKKSSFVAAVNLIALSCQKTGFPPLGLEWYLNPLPAGGTAPDMIDRDMIIVSETSAIPKNLSSSAPLNLGASDTQSGTIAYPHMIRAKGHEQSKGFLSKIFPGKGSKISDISIVDSNIVVTRFEPLVTKEKAALMQFQSPFDRKRTVLMLTAGNEADITKAGTVIWKPEVQATLSGDTALINLTENEKKEFNTLSMKIGTSYYLGGVTPLPFVEYYANTYPVWFIGGVVVTCFLLAVIFYQLIKIRRKKRFS
ncbi:MAG: cellulose biosynthesis cyclic di-GMP-binding regulatory protein BcsB, partial [Desulfamplus sp.]|nr:cellulose biosynthesis cyclic di-GMP-binding regulatory protein BcsB [Desulfamplus sp.]